AAGCAPQAVAEVAQLMRDGLESMLTVSDAEMKRARGQILGSSTLSLESTDARMNRLARSEFLGEFRDHDEAERLLAAVSTESVTDLAHTLIAESMSISAVGDVTPDAFASLV
ncbi:MAG: insulinase family protein, partial [Microbacteriaceae bacterium]|nr:insulinase family protein [Microbacteriaceae bacterium]